MQHIQRYNTQWARVPFNLPRTALGAALHSFPGLAHVPKEGSQQAKEDDQEQEYPNEFETLFMEQMWFIPPPGSMQARERVVRALVGCRAVAGGGERRTLIRI